MNEQVDIGIVLDRWLGDPDSTMPERVAIVVADRIGRQSQRRLRRLPRRLPEMNFFLKLGAGVAAVVLITVIGLGWRLTSTPAIGDGVPTSSTAPSPSPASTPASTPLPPMLQQGPLAARTYLVRSVSSDPSFLLSLAVPPGWSGSWGFTLFGPKGDEPPDGLAIAFQEADGLHSDPCHWDHKGDKHEDQPGDIAVGPTVDDLVNAIRANPAYTSSAATDVTTDGQAGRQLTIEVPSGVDLARCDNGEYLFWGASAGDGAFSAQAGSRWHLQVLDVSGRRFIVAVIDYPDTPEADRAAAQAIIDSIHFQP